MQLRSRAVLSSSLFLILSGSALAQQAGGATGVRDLVVTVGKSVIVDSPVNIERVSVASGAIAEAVATSPREIVVHGKSPGETTLIVWQQGGNRLIFDLTVRRNEAQFDVVRRELTRELAGQNVSFEVDGGNVFLHGTVRDLTAAQRAVAIVSTLGAPVNLLRVSVPPTDAQILLKVRFANVDRGATRELGLNLASTGLAGTPGRVTTGQFSPPQVDVQSTSTATQAQFTLSDALNIFFFRPDLNLGATIRALQSKRLLQILAEPNVLAINGRQASFLAGGEFPFPTLQGGGGGLGAVTIQFREFGVRINFTPSVTPRGTIRLTVTPEVSSLDFANGLVFQGFNIPALSTRRVDTEIELEEGQSFAIGGLLDNRVIENLNRIPGLGDIPFFGKLFRSQQSIRNNSELLVIVTPELVRPVPKNMQPPDLNYPLPFMQPNSPPGTTRTPPLEVTGPVPAKPVEPIPVEQLIQSQRPIQQAGQAAGQGVQYVPVLVPPEALQAPTRPGAPAPPPPPAAQPAAPKPQGAQGTGGAGH